MKRIKNNDNKTVCMIDSTMKIVEIVQKKKYKTTIQFLKDGAVRVINTFIH